MRSDGAYDLQKVNRGVQRMNRRDFNKTATTTAAFAYGTAALAKVAVEKEDRPNILFIITDQQHAGMMSCTGNQWLKTPAMDRLARDGIRFEMAYSANPVCVPSRTGMATGMMPGRLGATSNKNGMKIQSIPEEVHASSLGMSAKAAGYDTFYGGKVHMCRMLDPLNAGYGEYFKDQRDTLPDACINFMKRKRGRPFLAVASFINPHDICYAYTAYKNKGKGGNVGRLYREASALPLDQLPPLPENVAIPPDEPSQIDGKLSSKAVTPTRILRETYDEREWRMYRWIYCRLTERVDAEILRILEYLKEAGLEGNTLVLFTSDHGDMDASHRLSSKSQFYDESARLPFIMKYKGTIPEGKVDREHLVSTGLDILPTLRDYMGLGVSQPEYLLGRSLRNLAENRPPDSWRPYVASENAGHGRMIRSSKYKYCIYDSGQLRESLVDMENDPGEMVNLAVDSESTTELERHRQFLKEWLRGSDDRLGAEKYLAGG